MFLVDKTHLTSHFKLISKKPSPLPKSYQLAAKSFDEKILFHLKTLDLASDSLITSLNWMSKAVSFLSTVHVESEAQISNLRSESDYYHDLYMNYSQKVLDLSNLITSAVKQLTERRLLLNLSLRLLLLNSSGQISPEKLKKAKDALTRSVQYSEDISTEKGKRAKDLLKQLSDVINKLKIGKVKSSRDLICHTLTGLGALTVFVGSVLVAVLYGESDLVEVRVPTEFGWADSVNGVQKQIFGLIKSIESSNGGDQKRWLLEVEDTVNRAVTVCHVIDDVGNGGDENWMSMEDGVKDLRTAVARFSDGVDKLANGVNGLFSSVLKTRNGVLDGVRKGDW